MLQEAVAEADWRGAAGVFSTLDRSKLGIILRRDFQLGLGKMGLLLSMSDITKIVPEMGIGLEAFLKLCSPDDDDTSGIPVFSSSHDIIVEPTLTVASRNVPKSKRVVVVPAQHSKRWGANRTSLARTHIATANYTR